MPKCDSIWLSEMRDAAHRAHAYVSGVDCAAFVADPMRVDATIRQIELVGVATKMISEETWQKHPAMNWQHWKNTGDTLIRPYFDINLESIWAMATNEDPALVAQLDAILDLPQTQD